MPTRTRVVYIASLSHSGSTLLDLLLNAHGSFTSVGELKSFHRRAFEACRCTCGSSMEECAFWTGVKGRMVASGLDLRSFATDTDDLASLTGNVALLEAVGKQANGEIIVDSSKSVRRLRLLLSSPDLDVLPIFLIRDARGQICSMLRKGGRLLEQIREYNRTNRRIARLVRNRQHVVVRYEDLVRAPRTAIEPILSFFGESFQADQLNWAAAEKHSFAGNRMRHGNDSTVRADERWRSDLSPMQRMVIRAGTWWTRRTVLGDASPVSEPPVIGWAAVRQPHSTEQLEPSG